MAHTCILTDRSVLRLSGRDCDSLLQGIITQNIEQLKRQSCMYSLLLSPQGKILCDFFVHLHGEDRFVDIATPYVAMFQQKLRMYILRSDVQVDAASDYTVIASWGEDSAGCSDARHAAMGDRFIMQGAPDANAALEDYHAWRYLHGVPDAAYDADDKDVALDFGADAYNGVSFDKGCYVGQEVTARMHYRHIMRKCLYQVTGNPLPPSGTPITAGGRTLGEMRGHSGEHGLAMLRLEETLAALESGTTCYAGESEIQLQLPEPLAEKWQRYRQTAPS